MSFEMKVLPPNSKGEHFFNPSNAPLITLVRNLGIKHLRLGGTTVEMACRNPYSGYRRRHDQNRCVAWRRCHQERFFLASEMDAISVRQARAS